LSSVLAILRRHPPYTASYMRAVFAQRRPTS